MSREQIASELLELARRELKKCDVPKLEALDSLERLQLAVAIEDHFRIRLDEQDEREIADNKALVELIARKLDGSA